MIWPGVWAITKKIKWGDKIDGMNPLDENLTSHKTFISTIYFYEIFDMNEFNKQRKNLHLIKLSLYERRKQTFKKVIKNVNSYISFNVKLSRLNLFLYETYLHTFIQIIYLLTCLWTSSLFWRHTVLILNGAHYLRRGNEISVLPRLMP